MKAKRCNPHKATVLSIGNCGRRILKCAIMEVKLTSSNHATLT